MKRLALPVLLVTLSLPAATIVDSDKTATLHQGDGLAFEIRTWNFGYNAGRLGQPRYPTDTSFSS
jgi:hypothetical protein